MRHYDRTDFRHLNDAERYRDYDYVADDGWNGVDAQRFESPRAPREEQRPSHPSYVGRGPRSHSRYEEGERHGFFGNLRHPGQAISRVVRGLFHGKGPKNWTRSDGRIHDDVCERLAAHHDVDASEIEVKVEAGEVTLSGAVGDRRMKVLAEDAIEDVLGVKDIHNRLEVVAQSGHSQQSAGRGAR